MVGRKEERQEGRKNVEQSDEERREGRKGKAYAMTNYLTARLSENYITGLTKSPLKILLAW